jgi:hypothetical protein
MKESPAHARLSLSGEAAAGVLQASLVNGWSTGRTPNPSRTPSPHAGTGTSLRLLACFWTKKGLVELESFLLGTMH